MPSYKSVVKKIEALQKKAEALRQKELAIQQESADHLAKIAEIRGLMEKYNISLADLGGVGVKKSKKSTRPPVLPKYRDPVSGQTWSGRGRTPLWVLKAEADGKSRVNFAV